MARTKATVDANLNAASVSLPNGKMTLTKFLRLHPQNSIITAILKKRYGSKSYSEEEWFAIIEDILNGKIS